MVQTEKKPVSLLEFEKPIQELESMINDLLVRSREHRVDLTSDIKQLTQKLEKTRKSIYTSLTPWQRIQIVRHPQRPYTLDYLKLLDADFFELHGDRRFGDDQALIGGFATIGKEKVMLIGQQKGRNTKENIRRNFGCPNPEGYRKALRLMQMAERFRLPIVCFIDTPGAFPGISGEERHVAEAIAVNIRDMFGLQVPILAVVIGEGGSGGALGIGVADKVLILENGYYSVISPEGCAGILWKDRAYAPQAAAALKISSHDLRELKLVDEVIPEPEGGAHHDWEATAKALCDAIVKNLAQLKKLNGKQLLEHRHKKFRALGHFNENT